MASSVGSFTLSSLPVAEEELINFEAILAVMNRRHKTSVDQDNGDSDTDDQQDEISNKKTGYCHFNEDGSNKTFSLSLFGHNLEIQQDPSSQQLGHGAVVWDAAVIFTKYMEHDPKQFSAEKLHGKSIIELGSGCGLGGIAYMMKGAQVTLTDMKKVTDSLTESNAHRLYSQLNGKGKGALPYPLITPTVRALDWTDFESFRSDGEEEEFDFVLLTDCVFSATLAVPLVDCIRKLSGPRSTVYCCHEIRDEVELSLLVQYLRDIVFLYLFVLFPISTVFRGNFYQLNS